MLIPVIDMKLTGQNILILRQKRGMTVRELQSQLGFSTPQSIYKWQKGDTVPSVDNLVILGDIFDVTIDDIVVRREI